ncbi:T9SS sorting signal type C domain-containing protein [Flavobacterium ovatum]|uniref:Ig-like domain-containing protein n=1 Tax=Flavobacterium ovatum TaxID=1928857 RepID=UPI00344EF144
MRQIFRVLIMLFFFVHNVNSQCTLTGNINASSYDCGNNSASSSPLNSCIGVNKIVYIGDGTTPTIVAMNVDFNLTCLGPIQFIIRDKAILDFDGGNNKNLALAEGSSITIEPGGSLKSDNNCGASDLITIGNIKVASCNGGSALSNFATFISNGGYSSVNASASTSSICNSGTSTMTATANPSNGATYKWYDAASGGTLLKTGASYTTPTITSTTTYYVEAIYSSYTTVRKAVSITVSPTSAGGTASSNQTICNGSSPSNITLSGQTGTIQWQSSTNNSTFSNISGATSSTLTSAQMGTLTATRYYRAVVTSGSCASTNSNTVTVTINPTTVGGSISGGTTPFCQGGSTGTMTLSGHTGSIIQWERQVNNGGWTNVGNGGSTTYSETPFSDGNWQYRALIKSGSCPETYSSTRTIAVDQTPVGGAVNGGNTPICLNGSTGNMTLGSGYVGTIIRWEKRLNGGSWTNITNTTTTYSESPSTAGTWEYRALVGNGNCTSVYSSAFSVTVNPTLTITLGVNPIVCQTSTTASLSYSATTGSPAQWNIDFNAAANTAGFSDQTNSLSGTSGSITINVPYSTASGTYNGNLTVLTYTPSCTSTTYPISVTVSANPTANAGGALAAICQGSTSAAMGGSVGGGATGGTWSGGAGTWTNTNNPSTATYKASASESGSITLTLTTSGGSCGTTTATKTITVNQNPTANAGGALAAICQGSTSAAMGGSVGGDATGGTWSGGAGTWTNTNNPSTATYKASASESGSITLTLTTSGGSCGTTTATKTITVNQNPTANAGGALAAICQGSTSAAMGGSVGGDATGGTWSGGAGTWTNANNPSTATYTASASESGNITLTLTTSGGACGTTTATKTITVNPNPTATAGTAVSAICQGATSAAMGGSVGGGATGGTWTGGAGTWTNANNPSTATYTASASESGNITLTLTTSGGACGTTTATKTITVNPNPTATAGTAVSAICQGATSAAMGGSVGGGVTGGTWTGGTGTWTNANNPSTATYTANASESGSITLTLTTSGGACGTTTATKTITVNPNPTATAGTAVSAICQGATSAAMGGSVGGGATGGTWTGGTGTWTNANNPSTATYTASASDSGNITLTLTTSGGACGTTTATKTITVNPNPTATAGTAVSAICQGATSAAMGGSVGGGATGGTWTGGAGTWTNANNPSTATYTASASDSGNITLTLTTSGGACGTTTATKTITVNPNPTATAGTAVSAICQGATSAAMGGSVGGGATGGTWTGGAGTWTNANNPSTATYKASASESGSITLTLTTSGGACGTTTATKTITVNPNPTATAGTAVSAICQGATSAAMGGSVGGGATGGTWTGGAGTWTNANNPSTATYTASASESGNITLTLTTSGGACGTTTATKTITVNPNPTATAGTAVSAICQGATSAAMGGSVGGGATGGTWTGGAGTWTNANNPSTATYTASASESGSITLTLTTSGGACGTTTATKTITVNPNPTATAGTAVSAICQGATSAAMGGSVGGGATGGTWTGGTGTWTNANNPSTATYTASASESGNITLTLTTSGGACGTTTATKTITVNPNPTATAGTAVSAICQGATSAAMGGSVGGGATGGTWTGGTGTWTNANNPSTATYTASASESGNITLTLTTSGGACGTTTATKTITVNPNPTATAGTAVSAICQGATSAAMGGSVGGGATGGTWTGGAGTWTNANNPSTATYTASASESGSITLTLTTSGGACDTTTATKTITVNPTHTITAASNQTVCQNTAMTAITMTLGGGATGATVIGLPAGVTSTVSGATVTISGTPTGSGSFPYSVTTTGNTCTNASTNATITVNPIPSQPTIGTITQPNCISETGSVVLSSLPPSGTINQTGTATTTYIITGTTMTITGLNDGLYNFTTTSLGCTSPPSETIVLNKSKTNTWNGSSWSQGSPVSLNDKLVFSGNYSSATDANIDILGCSCKVTGGANVTIGTGRTMTIVNEVEILGSGSLTFENTASLVQINNDAINSGNITYNRTTGTVLKTDYTYWSSPVAGFTLGGIKAGTLYYSFNASGNYWAKASASTSMNPGVGYIVRGEGTGFNTGSTVVTAPFSGKPNNGNIGVSIVGGDASNLIGNPYPSGVDADAFLFANNSALEGTLYFWAHRTAIQLATDITIGTAGSGKYAYTSDDYITYNFTGSASPEVTNGIIGAGQGFIATGLSGGTATFTNSMRLGTSGEVLNNSKFFKPAASSKTAKNTATNKIEKNRVWLKLTNTQGALKQMLIGYITGATNDYDRGYDGVSYDGNSFIDFYSINKNTPLTIQGRALPFQDTDLVPLGYSSTIAGEFTISIDKTDGTLSNQNIYLEDKLNNTTQNLKENGYTFTTAKGIFNNRFVLTYKIQNTLGVEEIETLNNGLIISQNENEIKIASSELISEVLLFDFTGKLLLHKLKINNPELLLTNIPTTEQMILIKVKLNNGKTINKKIVF